MLGDGDGDAMPFKITFWAIIENSVPAPLLFGLKFSCVGVVWRGSHAGGLLGFCAWTNCTSSAAVLMPLPYAISANSYPAQFVCTVCVEGVTSCRSC